MNNHNFNFLSQFFFFLFFSTSVPEGNNRRSLYSEMHSIKPPVFFSTVTLTLSWPLLPVNATWKTMAVPLLGIRIKLNFSWKTSGGTLQSQLSQMHPNNSKEKIALFYFEETLWRVDEQGSCQWTCSWTWFSGLTKMFIHLCVIASNQAAHHRVALSLTNFSFGKKKMKKYLCSAMTWNWNKK